MSNFMLSFKADEDLDKITDYTLEVWGETQSRAYVAELLKCFLSLVDNPSLGRNAAEYTPDLKRHKCLAHTVFYESSEQGIFIVRILNQRQDFRQHL